jgi:hypothetical protein
MGPQCISCPTGTDLVVNLSNSGSEESETQVGVREGQAPQTQMVPPALILDQHIVGS